MYLTPNEALGLLRSLSRAADEARAEWDRVRAQRDELVALLDGQEGMARTAMAEACGLTRMNLWKMLDRRPEGVEEDVLLTDELREALEEAMSGDDVEGLAADRIRLDVHA